MEPPPKVASSAVSVEPDQVQQYGRRSSSLKAELSAPLLRDIALQTPEKPEAQGKDPAEAGKHRRNDTYPRTLKSSPVKPLTSTGVVPSLRRPPPRASPRHTNYQSQTEGGSSITLRNLGSDYSRYFGPPSESSLSSISRTANPSTVSSPFRTPSSSKSKLAKSRGRIDVEKRGSCMVDDRLRAPYQGTGRFIWPLICDEKEDDDDMHMPHPDDDLKFRPHWKDRLRRDSILSTTGVVLMITGLLFLFAGLPVLSALKVIVYNSAYETPLNQMPMYWPEEQPWSFVNHKKYPLLEHLRTGLIDPDTPKRAMHKVGEYGDVYELVFSDEFNDNNRTFYEGDDPYWFAPDLWYGATQDLEWFDPDAVTTWDGTLELRLDKFPNHGLDYRSGMLNSWNQVCFKGGIFEVSMSLPGPAAVMGLWPGAWTMGNLGRPGYLSTTEGLWPYTYQACDVGITPNQSSSDGLSYLPGQRLPSCTCPGEDHPTPGNGRGAPEIDIVEAGASYGGLPIATQSYQVAPFDIWWRPDYNFTAFPDYGVSYTNGYTGGPFQQAISATTNLNPDWYDGNAYQKYSFEYVPGEGKDAYIVWKVGGETTFMMDGRAIGPNGNIQARQISQEPMSMILNLGYSTAWTEIQYGLLRFPTVMRVDSVRWYQKKGETMVTCDPPGYETTEYIKDHISAYTNPNLTKWDQTGYGWPKHKLNSDC